MTQLKGLFHHIHIKVIFQFFFGRAIAIVDVTDDVTMLHQGYSWADIYRMVQVMARYEDGGTSLLVVLLQQVLDDGL